MDRVPAANGLSFRVGFTGHSGHLRIEPLPPVERPNPLHSLPDFIPVSIVRLNHSSFFNNGGFFSFYFLSEFEVYELGPIWNVIIVLLHNCGQPPAFPLETPETIKEYIKEKHLLPRLDEDFFSPENVGRQWEFDWFDRAKTELELSFPRSVVVPRWEMPFRRKNHGLGDQRWEPNSVEV